ncbi:hypothetical protein ACIQF5_20950 [Streptomyces goshikiensis]
MLLLLNAYVGAWLLTHEHVELGVFTTGCAVFLVGHLAVRAGSGRRMLWI